MVKGVAIKFKSYQDSVSSILNVIKLGDELKKFDKIVLKPYLSESESKNTDLDFTEAILKYCLANKNPVADVFIAEGSDGADTKFLFDKLGYKNLAEKYSLGLVDLNETEVSEIQTDFTRFEKIYYPKLLENSFVISIPRLSEDIELGMIGSMSNMLGAFPLRHYKGLFSNTKKKIRKWPIKFSIHDIIKCKMPNLAIIDASAKGYILAGQPLDVDKKGAILLFKDWKTVPYLKFMDEVYSEKKKDNFVIPEEKEAKPEFQKSKPYPQER